MSNEKELWLKVRKPYVRELLVRLNRGHVSAHLFIGSTNKSAAYGGADLSRCRISDGCLWVDHSAFDVTAAEIERIVAEFRLPVRDCARPTEHTSR